MNATKTVKSVELTEDIFSKLDAIIETTPEETTEEKELAPFSVGSVLYAQFTKVSSVMDFVIVKETEKAVLLECIFTRVWFPKSAFHIYKTIQEETFISSDVLVKPFFRRSASYIWG